MEFNIKKWSKKQKIIAGAVVAVLLVGGGTTVAVVNHNNQVKAEQLQKEKAYQSLKDQAKQAVEKVERFQAQEDVLKASEAIKKLKSEDQTDLLKRTDTLAKLWNEVASATTAVTKAEKAKTDKEVTNAQKVIDGLKDKKQATKKAELQKRLDVVKNALKKAKAEAEAKAKAEADKKAQEAAAAQAQAEQANQEAQASVNNASVSDSSGAYSGSYVQAPATPQDGGQAVAPSYQAPATPSTPAAPPVNTGGGKMGSGYQDPSGEELAQNEKDANNADWSDVFGKK